MVGQAVHKVGVKKKIRRVHLVDIYRIIRRQKFLKSGKIVYFVIDFF